MTAYATHTQLLEAALTRCNIDRNEGVALLSSRIIDPHDLAPYEEACRRVSDNVVSVRYYPTEITDAHVLSPLLRATLSQADFVLHYRGSQFPTPFAQITGHSKGMPEVVAANTRWLDICLNEANQFRLFPSDEVVQETLRAREQFVHAKEIRLTSAAGTDLVMRKDGRKVHRQLGIADRPGVWDNFGFAMVTCAPLEESANGVLYVPEGDALLQMGRTVRDAMKLTLRDGKIISIEGGETAQAMSQWLERSGDPESFGVSHIGWGLHPGAVWTGSPKFSPVDGESYRGSILIAFGTNDMNMPAEYSGIGGKRHCRSHLDLPLLTHSFAIDGKPTVADGKLV